MALLDIRQRTGYLFLVVTIAHIVLISAQVNTRHGVPMLEAVTFGVFAEVQRGASWLIGSVQRGWEGYFALQRVREDNERLRREVGQLQIRLQEERAVARQSRSLQELLELRQRTALSTTAAAVIAGEASPDFRTMTIDKGSNDGLRPDQAVISPAGVVGRLIMPSARAAKVQLLIDRNAAAGALVERSRAQGVVLGTGSDRLRLEYVSGAADIQVGDAIVTSGIDGIYPKGFVIGQIESIERGAGVFGAIVVTPAVDFTSIEEVLVVLTPPVPADAVPASEPGTVNPEPGT
ncbi:MAG: rod shape-determining protein MreC [Vicinamibacterales bacterium]